MPERNISHYCQHCMHKWKVSNQLILHNAIQQTGVEALLPKMSMNPFCEIALEVTRLEREMSMQNMI